MGEKGAVIADIVQWNIGSWKFVGMENGNFEAGKVEAVG
jgi:hypothetical protein